jgi:hypothetical protein
MKAAKAHFAGLEHFLDAGHEGQTDAVSQFDVVKAKIDNFLQHLLASGMAPGVPAGGKRNHFA